MAKKTKSAADKAKEEKLATDAELQAADEEIMEAVDEVLSRFSVSDRNDLRKTLIARFENEVDE